MKLALLTPVYPPYKGGIGQVARQEAEELVKRGYQVTVFTPLYQQADLDFTPKGYQLVRMQPSLKFGNAAWIRSLNLSGFDIVHLHYPFIGVVNALVKGLPLRGIFRREKRSKVFVTYHMDLIGQGWKKLFFKIYNFLTLPKIVKQADKIIVSSLDYARHGLLVSYLAQEPQKFVEVPFGVETEDLGFRVEGKDIRERKILFVGGLDKAHYFKGVDILLRAFSLLLGQTSSASWRSQLSIVGDGDLRPYYENLARKLRVEKQIIFLGKLDQGELNKVYPTADVLVLPSIDSSEAYGLVVLEAMANGLSIIASDLPGVRTNINSERGCLIKPGDAQALAQSLKELLSDDTRRKKMGENAREWVRANRTLSGEIDKLEKVLVDAVSCKL